MPSSKPNQTAVKIRFPVLICKLFWHTCVPGGGRDPQRRGGGEGEELGWGVEGGGGGGGGGGGYNAVTQCNCITFILDQKLPTFIYQETSVIIL